MVRTRTGVPCGLATREPRAHVPALRAAQSLVNLADLSAACPAPACFEAATASQPRLASTRRHERPRAHAVHAHSCRLGFGHIRPYPRANPRAIHPCPAGGVGRQAAPTSSRRGSGQDQGKSSVETGEMQAVDGARTVDPIGTVEVA